MDPHAWARLSVLLDEALELEPEARERWLRTLPPEDDGLRSRLASLLAHAEAVRASDLLGTLPKVDVDEIDPPDQSDDHPGAIVGPYRLLRPLGEGGMGAVWLAERTDGLLQRPVALKLPRGAWSGRAVAERLARERQILAALTHPHIARLYDAGATPGGRPYLALEYVDGQPIDVYCQSACFGARAIVRVFLQVAGAVVYAHSKLVVHRDLKPSNILVTPEGQVRLLDFGIAKLIDEASTTGDGLTELAGCPQTPEYASPEQVAGEPLSTASDVYSLGIVLFELLAGQRPYTLPRDSRRGMEAAILQTDVTPPSQLAADESSRRSLRGDLDTIVLKALRKAPDERYASAAALADDLERWLDGRPILARPASRIYRVRKFVTRHRAATAAALVALSATIGGAAAAMWQAREARAQRAVAVAERQRADADAEHARRAARIAQAHVELTDYMTADLSIGRSTTELEQQLERAIAMVDQRFAGDRLVRTNLLFAIAGRLRQLGSFQRHRTLVADLLAAPRAAGDEDIHAQITCWHARDVSQTGNGPEARRLMDGVLKGLRARQPLPATVLISCLADDSAIARLAGDAPRAVASVEELARLEESRGLSRTEGYTDTLLLLARAYGQAGRYRDGEAAATRSLALRREIGHGETTGAINTRIIQATLLRDGGQPHRALPILSDLLAAHRARGGAPQSIPVIEYEQSLTLIRLGRAGDALPLLDRVQRAAAERADATLVRATAIARVVALVDSGSPGPARSALAEAEPLYTPLRASRQYAGRQFLFARIHLALAERDLEAAQLALDEARGIVSAVPNPTDPAWRWVHVYAARVALARQQYEDSRASADRALALSRQQAIDESASLFAGEDHLLRAEAVAASGNGPLAAEDARAALAHFAAVGATSHPRALIARTLAR